jgi:Arc/MetJ-type ribon-helix-helix transcriptional regulator
MSDVINNNLQLWRQKARDGTITQEEMREAIAAIRKERVNASTVSATAKTKAATAKAKAAPIDSDALLDGLM